MSPKEKSKELVDKYYNRVNSFIDHHMAKQCALIAVDELIRLESDFDNYYPQHKFWQQVKIEIENL